MVVSPKVVPSKTVTAAPPATPVNDKADMAQIVEEAARNYDVDPALVHSIVKVESNYNPYALSNKGAEGLMQLIPSTARKFGARNSFDPRENVEAGVRYYKYLQSIYHDDRLALAAYNAGEGAVAKYNNQIPPYPETINYVYQVGKHWGEESKRRRSQAPAAAAKPAPQPPPAPEHPKLEHFTDEQGRLVIRTARQ